MQIIFISMLIEEYQIIFATLSHLKNQRRPVLSMDMPLAVAQLGHVQEHLQELQWNLSSPMELQWNLNTGVPPPFYPRRCLPSNILNRRFIEVLNSNRCLIDAFSASYYSFIDAQLRVCWILKFYIFL